MSTATGTLGEGNLGALNVMPQLIYSLHIAFNRPSFTPGTYKALSWDYSWTSKSIILFIPCNNSKWFCRWAIPVVMYRIIKIGKVQSKMENFIDVHKTSLQTKA
jgi:hypothetical protein